MVARRAHRQQPQRHWFRLVLHLYWNVDDVSIISGHRHREQDCSSISDTGKKNEMYRDDLAAGPTGSILVYVMGRFADIDIAFMQWRGQHRWVPETDGMKSHHSGYKLALFVKI